MAKGLVFRKFYLLIENPFYTYLSVSGQKFAMLEMKVVISEILLHYRLLPSENTKELTLETGIVLQSLDNFPVRITTRNSVKVE